ncbi:MAG: DUF4468 domain-containing protein [Vicingaceae bacterium]
MLKYTLLSAAFILSAALYSQEIPVNESGKYEYSEVVVIEGATKEQIFRTARKWFQKNYSEKAVGEKVIYTDDSYLGEMAANPNMFIDVRVMGSKVGAGSVNYNIVLAAKEGKYKYGINGFYHESNRSSFGSGGALENAKPDCGEEMMSAEAWSEIKKECHQRAAKLIESLKDNLAEAASNSEDDW